MPWNPDGTRKKPSTYKMKYQGNNSAFPFKTEASTKTKKWYVDNYEENKGKPGFKEAMNKAFGGETKMKGKTSITTKKE